MDAAGNVVWVDTETLGLDADHQPIWEVGLIDAAGGEHHWFLQLTPRQISLAHPAALEIGRFEERYEPDQAVPPTLFAHQFSALVKGCHLAGAVVSFDEERIRRLCWEHGAPITWHYHIIDIEPLIAGYLKALAPWCHGLGITGDDKHWPDGLLDLPWNSNDLSRAVGVNPDDYERHTALGDAAWARACYQAVMGS